MGISAVAGKINHSPVSDITYKNCHNILSIYLNNTTHLKAICRTPGLKTLGVFNGIH